MADLRWNAVNANFNDVNSGIGHAIQGYSNVGTIFGNLRKSILDEEQRAVDNAFKAKQIQENIRQFDERLGFDKGVHADNEKQRAWDNQFKLDEFDWKKQDAKEKNSISLMNARASLRSAAASERANSLKEEERAFNNFGKKLDAIAMAAPSMSGDEYYQTMKMLAQTNDPRAQALARTMSGYGSMIQNPQPDGSVSTSFKPDYQALNARDKANMTTHFRASYDPKANEDFVALQKEQYEQAKGEEKAVQAFMQKDNEDWNQGIGKGLAPSQRNDIEASTRLLTDLAVRAGISPAKADKISKTGVITTAGNQGMSSINNWFTQGEKTLNSHAGVDIRNIGGAGSYDLNKNISDDVFNVYRSGIADGTLTPYLTTDERNKLLEALDNHRQSIVNPTKADKNIQFNNAVQKSKDLGDIKINYDTSKPYIQPTIEIDGKTLNVPMKVAEQTKSLQDSFLEERKKLQKQQSQAKSKAEKEAKQKALREQEEVLKRRLSEIINNSNR